MDLSIVIPSYNEEKRLAATLHATLRYFDRSRLNYEIVVVNDGSRDGTLRVLEELAKESGRIQVLSYANNKGKGYALKKGFASARGRLILMMDADLSTKLFCVEKMFEEIRNGADIVIGSRKSGNSRVRTVFSRKLFGYFFSVCVRVLLGMRFVDTQCGFKLMRRDVTCTLKDLRENRFLFDVEFLYRAKKMEYKIVESPVVWTHTSNSKVSIWHDAPLMLISLLRFWLSGR